MTPGRRTTGRSDQPSGKEREVEPLHLDPERPGCIAGRPVCPRPVVAILTAGCVHEHIRRGRVCQQHLDKKLTCRSCETNTAQPHMACYVHHLDVEIAS